MTTPTTAEALVAKRRAIIGDVQALLASPEYRDRIVSEAPPTWPQARRGCMGAAKEDPRSRFFSLQPPPPPTGCPPACGDVPIAAAFGFEGCLGLVLAGQAGVLVCHYTLAALGECWACLERVACSREVEGAEVFRHSATVYVYRPKQVAPRGDDDDDDEDEDDDDDRDKNKNKDKNSGNCTRNKRNTSDKDKRRERERAVAAADEVRVQALLHRVQALFDRAGAGKAVRFVHREYIEWISALPVGEDGQVPPYDEGEERRGAFVLKSRRHMNNKEGGSGEEVVGVRAEFVTEEMQVADLPGWYSGNCL